MEEEKLNKAINLIKSEIEIYDQYYCLATSQALKTILKELERLQVENKKLKIENREIKIQNLNTTRELLARTDRLNKLSKENIRLERENMENDLKVIGAEEYTKASMSEIIERYYTANEDCIPKRVIRDKIEELNEYYKKEICNEEYNWADIDITEFYNNQIGLLKEILGEE